VVFFSDNGGVRYQAKRTAPVTNNTPFRAGKGHLYEGGIREPLLIRWPGVTRPGSLIDTPVSSVDFAPTFCDTLQISAPAQVDGVSEFYEDGRLELFDLEADPGERRNLILKSPATAAQLHRALGEWRGSVNAAMPKPNPNFDPARASEGLAGYEAATPPVS
jgi:hypothetical protein